MTHLRATIRKAVPDAEETIKWGAPAYVASGQILLIFASFKAHVAVNFWRGKELMGDEAARDAMGQFGRITALDDLPPAKDFAALVKAAATLATTSSAPRQPKKTPKPEKLHPELAAALAKAPKAKAVYEGFPPSCRREYCDWINEAKRDETRAKRIAQAIEWMAEGKKRNWKYENC